VFSPLVTHTELNGHHTKLEIMTLVFYCRQNVQCVWRAIYVQVVFLLRIVHEAVIGVTFVLTVI
jgi:hypothetical protein